MNLWLAISLVIAVISVYLLTIEIFSVAFKLTGLSTSKIRFQVGSLFTGAGFTTAESELIANNTKRRKIALACMYTGHVFSVAFMGLIINVIFSVIIMITSTPEAPKFTEWYFIILYVSLGFLFLVLLIKIPPINKHFIRFLEMVAINASKHKRNTNIVTVLDMYGKSAMVELILNIVPSFANETPLYKMGLNKKYAINLLSIKRGTRVIDVTKDTMFKKGDILVMYGPLNDINEAFVKSVNNDGEVLIVDKINDVALINNYGDNALVEVYVEEVPKELDNVTMQEAHLKDKYNITIGIIKRKDDYVFVDKDTIIQKGDTLTLFGPYKNIKVLFEKEKN